MKITDANSSLIFFKFIYKKKKIISSRKGGNLNFEALKRNKAKIVLKYVYSKFYLILREFQKTH